MDRHSQIITRGRPVTGKDVANAKDYFEYFLNATSLKNILGYYRSICELLNLKPNLFPLFYPKLRNHLTSWRAKALWKKFDLRSQHKCYGKGKLCSNTRVLIIGAGPCGLRTAIEAQLLGAKVVVIEKRDRLSRNNVLHLWPFVIEDLRALGAKKFFGKFCAGSIDHISIRQIQCILLKVALLLGVEVHTEVSFEQLIEPNLNEKTGWKAEFKPSDHPVSQYVFDVIIGADGKRNTLQGFKRKEFRGKLAIAITANFINKRTEAEARVEEISGVAFIFNQKFFKELHKATGIDLENIVYYKDDTHYFVMTAKKTSLIEKGVIKQDLNDTERLLAPDNVNRDALMDYAREAANFSTNYQMFDMEFAVNHYGQPDVAMFDFTSMYAAENASKIIERNNYRLLTILVGDSLLEPFWPTGSGCARGFLSSMDAAWAIRSWGSSNQMSPLDVIAERESIYRLLAQTTPDNLNKDCKAYTLDPATRYPNLNKNVVLPHQVFGLYDTDNPKNLEKLRRNNAIDNGTDVPKKRRRTNVDSQILLNWIQEQIKNYSDIEISDLSSILKNGRVLCAILNHYRPDLLDFAMVQDGEPVKNNQLAMDILEKELGISPIMTAEELTNTDDYLTMATYLTQVYDCFRCEIPHIKHPKLSTPSSKMLETIKDNLKMPEIPPKTDNLQPYFLSDPNSEYESNSSSEIKESLVTVLHVISKEKLSGNEILCQHIKYDESKDELTIYPKIVNSEECKDSVEICHNNELQKFSFSKKAELLNMKKSDNIEETNQNLNKVSNWIISNNFDLKEVCPKIETNLVGSISDITSVSKNVENQKKQNDFVVEERTEIIKTHNNEIVTKPSQMQNLRVLRKLSQFTMRKNDSFLQKCPIIVEDEEFELPIDSKRSDATFKTIKEVPSYLQLNQQSSTVIRPSSRHKRHADLMISANANKIHNSVERKARKRRTIEKVGASIEERQRILQEIAANRFERQNKRRQQRKLQTEQFIKSMQMLQANALPDLEPFEDYSLFVYRQTAPNFEDRVKNLEKQFIYVPDHENKLPNLTRGGTDEDIAARIKTMEDKWKEPQPVDKKPKDLMRAIGKIETSDWNIQEIEKKIRENKMGKPSTTNKDKEKVPKWSKEQFLARQTKMEKKHLPDRQDSCEAKFADIDKSIKHLDMKLKEGTSRDLGHNKIATITEKLTSKVPENEPKPAIQKSSSRTAIVMPTPQAGSEFCHFCGKRVYLMERLSAEGRFFHHGCFKCQYCHTQLRLGSYSFDRDGIYGHKFFCIHHYGMQGELKLPKIVRRQSHKRPEIKILDIDNVDLLNNRVQTPERVEFSNLFTVSGNLSSDHEENLSQMDEDEWTDKNFGASTAEFGSTSDDDDESSSLSDTDSDDEDAYEEAIEEPATKEGTLKWAERFNKRYSKKRNNESDLEYDSSGRSSYYENSTDDDDSDTATEGEEEIRARELRKQEVRVEPPVVVDTGTDTEIVSEGSSSDSSSNEIRNSATEISTDSEFAQDEPTPTREIPSIVFNDFHVTKTRGSGQARKIQITSGYLQKPKNQKPLPTKTNKTDDIELKLTPLVPSITPIMLRKPILRNTADGYALNRTQSTGGIAAKVSLELKKKYLLGNEMNCPGNIQKSGSASTLDTKLKSFHTNISDCQKLLKPATEISPIMHTFCTKLDEITPKIEEKSKEVVFQNELEGRPRSPVHETSIIVPKIDWSKKKSSSEDSLSDHSPNFQFENIPTVNVEKVEDIPLDSLCLEGKQDVKEEEEENETPKSITGDKKTLNQPKLLPNWDLTNNRKQEEDEDKSVGSNAALTETELSDWARDDDFDELKKYDDIGHVCGKDKKETKNKIIITEAMNNVLSKNLDNIEFMDTGTEETSSDDNLTNNGYVLFKDEEELPEDSLNPIINTGYCIIEPTNRFGGDVIDLKPSDLEKFKQTQSQEHEEDSLLIIETQEMTENSDTTTPITVKAEKETEKSVELLPKLKGDNGQKQRLEEKLAKIKAERQDSLEFQEHCQRLQSKIEFGNVKDSIDIRKSRRKSKSDSPPQKPDLIQEESPIIKEIMLNLTPTVLYKKELIEKERDVNQKLIQDLVMDKMKAENKTLERKKRNRLNKFELSKSATVDLNNRNITPDVILTASPLQKSQTINEISQKQRPLSLFSVGLPENPEKFTLPDISQTPKAPPRLKHDESKKTNEKLKQEARLRARLLSNEELGLSPEDKLNKIREKINRRDLLKESIESLVLNTERRNSWLYSNDPVVCKKNEQKNLADLRTKSISEISRDEKIDAKLMYCKSDPNLLLDEKKINKKGKDRERRKSLTKLFTTLFTKKSPNSKGLFSRISPQKKDVSKEIVVEEPIRRNSFSEVSRQRIKRENNSPPPIPPLPLNYTGNSIKGTDESSEGEHDWRKLVDNKSSCDTLDHINSSMSSLNSNNRKSKGAAKKVARQTQLKRHRMAQEIQRKLEETEVKTRELEERGVSVEKALRGEDCDNSNSKDESVLLQEWFDLMRDRTELRRYEKELMVRAQELELEDRHARLQHELRERLDNNEEKTQNDVQIEGSIINEMMEIVAKRDSLIAVLEEDRLRYSNEDRDLEEQMLAKGLRLTPVRKSTTEK